MQGFLQQNTEFSGEISTEDRVLCLLWNAPNYHQTYEEILDIFLHYFDFVSCYKKCK